jgi:trigger factor
MKKTIKKLPKSQVQIEVSLPEEIFNNYREKTLKHMGEHVEVSGFRKGKAPHHMVEKNLKPMALLEEMAQSAISEHLPKILVEEKIDAIGRPMITITKLAEGNPLEFVATVDVFPEVELSDYKKIASKLNKDKKDIEVSDEKLDKAIIDLKKARAHAEKIHDEETGEEINHEHKEGEETFDSNLTVEDVKKFGPFETVEDFKNKFRENIKFEEEARDREKRRVAMLEEIIEGTKMELPDVLIQSELENLFGRLKMDITNAGLKFDDYLNHIKKTEEDIRKEFLPDAEKRAKMEFIMYKIGDAEKITPNEEEITKEVKRLMEMYNDADENRARAYVTHLLSNEQIFRFLEGLE